MPREVDDHPAHHDEADLHARSRRIPPLVAIAVALLAIAALIALRMFTGGY